MDEKLLTNDKIGILSRLCRIGNELASSTDLDELLAKISRCVCEVTDSETSSIILKDERTNKLYFKQVTGDLGEIIKRIKFPLNEHSIAGWTIINKAPQIINDVSQDPRHYKKVDEKTRFVTRSILAVPIVWGENVFGCIEALNKNNPDGFDERDQEYLTVLAHQAAVALKNVFIVERLQNFFNFSVEIIISALEAIDPASQGHIMRVARLAVTTARLLGYEGKTLQDIWYSSYFHDIGKLTRDNIYTPEREIENVHPFVGASLIENIKVLEHTAPIVRFHHERYDGSGFPEGRKGNEIPRESQILGIAEEYDEQKMKAGREINIMEFNGEFLKNIEGKFAPDIIEVFGGVLENLGSSGRL